MHLTPEEARTKGVCLPEEDPRTEGREEGRDRRGEVPGTRAERVSAKPLNKEISLRNA